MTPPELARAFSLEILEAALKLKKDQEVNTNAE